LQEKVEINLAKRIKEMTKINDKITFYGNESYKIIFSKKEIKQ
jgi:hypothetical protein